MTQGPEIFGSHHVCPHCACAWFGDPECWSCGAWVSRVRTPAIVNPGRPREDAVGVPLTL